METGRKDRTVLPCQKVVPHLMQFARSRPRGRLDKH